MICNTQARSFEILHPDKGGFSYYVHFIVLHIFFFLLFFGITLFAGLASRVLQIPKAVVTSFCHAPVRPTVV